MPEPPTDSEIAALRLSAEAIAGAPTPNRIWLLNSEDARLVLRLLAALEHERTARQAAETVAAFTAERRVGK